MAMIELIAMGNNNGPSLPCHYRVWLEDRPWPSGGTVRVLKLSVGQDTIQIWPVDTEMLQEFGEKILKIVKELKDGRETEG